jgi:hypothetical protein
MILRWMRDRFDGSYYTTATYKDEAADSHKPLFTIRRWRNGGWDFTVRGRVSRIKFRTLEEAKQYLQRMISRAYHWRWQYNAKVRREGRG